MITGEQLQNLRVMRRVTQEHLAASVGVSRSAVAQWETGRAGFARFAESIAAVLRVNVSAIVGDDPHRCPMCDRPMKANRT